MGGFIPEETLVLAGTAGDNGTTGETLHQPVLGFLALRDESPPGRHFVRYCARQITGVEGDYGCTK